MRKRTHRTFRMRRTFEGNEQSDKSGWLWMIACCIPMIAILALIALGYQTSR